MTGVLGVSDIVGFGEAAVWFRVFWGMGSGSEDRSWGRVKVLSPLVPPCSGGQWAGAGLLAVAGEARATTYTSKRTHKSSGAHPKA